MWSKLAFSAATVTISLVLTFAPVVAQETVGPNDSMGDTANVSDDNDGPELGWLGLIGLVGLGGLMKRDRTDRDHADRTTHR